MNTLVRGSSSAPPPFSTNNKMQRPAVAAAAPKGSGGKFRRLVSLVIAILRAFSGQRRIAIHPTWNKSMVIPLGSTLPSPTRHKHKPGLQQLSQPGAIQALANRIHQRLQVQPTTTQEKSPLQAPAQNGSRVPEMTSNDFLPADAQKILTNSSWTRTTKEIDLVYQNLQPYTAFQDYPPHVQRQICKVGWYQRLEPGRIVFKERQQPSSFYLILSGSVKVMKLASGGYDEVIQTLKPGQVFGDTAIAKRQDRSSTCIASSTTELLAISKSDYVDLSLRQSRLSYQRDKHFAFCKTISLMKYFPLSELEAQPERCTVKYFKANSVVCKDSKKCEWVHILMTGSCRVVKRFVNSSSRASLQHDLGDPVLKKIGHPKVESKLVHSKTTAGERGGDDASLHQGRRRLLKHSHTISHLPTHSEVQQSSSTATVKPSSPTQKQFLVQLQILHPKDTFGLSSILHTAEPSITLVSNGADIVSISKEFLLMHMTEMVKVKLQRKVMQYPSEEAMRKRIKDYNTWKLYKHSMVHQVRSRQIH